MRIISAVLSVLCFYKSYVLAKYGDATDDVMFSSRFVGYFGLEVVPDAIHIEYTKDVSNNTVTDISSEFNIEQGLITWEISYKPGSMFSKPTLLLYYDYEKWEYVVHEGDERNCGERAALANINIPLFEDSFPSISRSYENEAQYKYYVSTGEYVARGSFYLTEEMAGNIQGGIYSRANALLVSVEVVNCDLYSGRDCSGWAALCQGPIVTSGHVLFTNGQRSAVEDSDTDHKFHASYEERNMMPVMFVSMVMALGTFLYAVWVRQELDKKGKLHAIVKVLFLSTLFRLAGVVCLMAHWRQYLVSGHREEALYRSGLHMANVSQVLLLLHLILVSKGWRIVRRHLSTQAKVKIASFGIFYFISNVFVVEFKLYLTNGKLLVNPYSTAAGLADVFIEIGALFWFHYAIRTTVSQFDRKVRFYRKFQNTGGVYLSLMPLMQLISISLDWSEWPTFLAITDTVVYTTAHVIIITLFVPGMSFNRAFPFNSDRELEFEGRTMRLSSKDDWEMRSESTDIVTGTGTGTKGSIAFQEGGAGSAGNAVSNDIRGSTRTIEVGRGMSQRDAEDLFDEIKSVFAYVSKKVLSLEPIGTELRSVLEDWDFEDEADKED